MVPADATCAVATSDAWFMRWHGRPVGKGCDETIRRLPLLGIAAILKGFRVFARLIQTHSRHAHACTKGCVSIFSWSSFIFYFSFLIIIITITTTTTTIIIIIIIITITTTVPTFFAIRMCLGLSWKACHGSRQEEWAWKGYNPQQRRGKKGWRMWAMTDWIEHRFLIILCQCLAWRLRSFVQQRHYTFQAKLWPAEKQQPLAT